MKILLFVSIVMLQFVGCDLKGQKNQEKEIVGVYILKSDKLYQALSDNNYSRIELYKDGTYILDKADVLFTPVLDQCDYASKGKWSVVTNNLLEITSEDYYTKQKGFEYEIKKENKLSQDSLYIQVNFPNNFHPVKLNFTFNYNNHKSITTDKTNIVLPKSKYLLSRKTAMNKIVFNLNADISGIKLYKSRVLFEIFEEYIDTEKNNYITITLPNFDRCFFEFEPYYKELIYIKDKNQLFWRGEVWRK